MAQHDTREATEKLKAIIEGRALPEPEPPHPERIALYGGLSGATVEAPVFEVLPGLNVRETYAHVFGTYMVAFSKPTHERAPHPGPWVAATGGFGFDVTVEVSLEAGVRPADFDRLNTLWWTTALLRLRSGAAVRVPVVSSAPFAATPHLAANPTIWGVETNAHQLRLAAETKTIITLDDLRWVQSVFLPGAELMSDENFGRAFSLFDSIRWSHDIRAAVTLTWSALEAVLRPSSQSKNRALSASLPAFLREGQSERSKMYAMVSEYYETRCDAAHAALQPRMDTVFATFEIARAFFVRCLEHAAIPNAEDLIKDWKAGA